MESAEDDPKVAAVVAAAAARGLEIHPLSFPGGTRTATDAAGAVGCHVGQIVKSLVFMTRAGPVLFLVSGANRLDETKAAAAAGVERLGKADAEEVKRATGYSIGATPPLGHAAELEVFMDEDLLAFAEVWAAAGRVDSVFAADPVALRNATRATVASLRK